MLGRVILKNFWKLLQPSMDADSYSSCGTLCNAARNTTMFQPTPFQIPNIMAMLKPPQRVSSHAM